MTTRNTSFINFYLNIHTYIQFRYFPELFKSASDHNFRVIDNLRKFVRKDRNVGAIVMLNFEITFTSGNRPV